MKLDENMRKRLLSLNDDEVRNVVKSLAQAAGIGSKMKISDSDISKLRDVVKNATEHDAEKALERIGEDNAEKIFGELEKGNNGKI